MIIAAQMQHAVYDKEHKFPLDRMTVFESMGLADVGTDDYLTKAEDPVAVLVYLKIDRFELCYELAVFHVEHRKRENIGYLVDASVLFI